MSNTDSPLHIAIRDNNIEIAKLLLASQCDIHAANAEGLTPLQLATQAGNAEMVTLLLQHGAGKQSSPASKPSARSGYSALPDYSRPTTPPIEFSPLDAEQRKQRIRFWTTAHNVLLVLTTVVSCLFSIAPENDPDGFGMNLLILLVSLVGIYALCLYYFVFRIWEEVPASLARTTPRKGAGFLFIPFYYMYWNFVAFRGLYLDMNKSLEQLGTEKRFPLNESRGIGYVGGGITGICWFWLIYGIWTIISVIMYMEWDIPTRVTTKLMMIEVFYCLATAVEFCRIRTDVVEFIDIKSHSGST